MINCGATTVTGPWQGGTLVFNVDDTVRSAHSLYYSNPYRLNYTQLDTIDVLVVQQSKQQKFNTHFWSEWFTRSTPTPIILLIFPEDEILVEDGERWKKIHRLLRHRKYNIQSDLVKAELCGASTRERYFVSLCTLDSVPSHTFNIDDDYLPLPLRSVENMIETHLTLSHQFIRKSRLKATDNRALDGQSNLLGYCRGKPVYGLSGPIGGQYENQFILIPEKGIRPIIKKEWCKLRGYVESPDHSVSFQGVLKSIPSHVWSLLSRPLTRLLAPSVSPPPVSPPIRPFGVAASTSIPSTSTWTWNPPPLDENSTFRRESIGRLVTALESFPSDQRDALFREGLTLLEKHSLNYTDKGPQKLVLLWWEWPSEHWVELCHGVSMNFIETPTPQILPNQKMTPEHIEMACQFMDQLIDLEVFLACKKEDIKNNFPLFIVPKPKPEQAGEFRCIADGKKGGQNSYCIPDPVQMTSPDHILPHLYKGGYSAVVDMSKYFHCFKTVKEERQYMGIFHPKTNEPFVYGGCPMGSRNSPGGTGRFGMSFIRYIIDTSDLFNRDNFESNTFANLFEGERVFCPERGEGRVFYSSDRSLSILIWLHIDDILVHGPTMAKVEEALTHIVTCAFYFGLIIQPVKVELPSHVVQYCGFLYDTTDIPCLVVPDYKLTRASTMVKYLKSGSYSSLARHTLSICVGNLQSLVPATPSNIGACFLRSLYDDLHNLRESPVYGTKAYYFTTVDLSPASLACLDWWEAALKSGLKRFSHPSDCSTIGVTWGDGSGTGAGGSATLLCNDTTKQLPKMDIWMGVWNGLVHSFSSNWKELRTLELTLLLETKRAVSRVRHRKLFYFTDNQVTYDIVHRSSSSSPELMKLILNIRLLELQLGCQLEVIHVPGVTMIHQGTDGFSRGVLPSYFHTLQNYNPMKDIFRPAIFSYDLMAAVFHILGLPPKFQSWNVMTEHTPWPSHLLLNASTFWVLPSQLARQAVLQASYSYCEAPLTTSHIFVIPRLQLRQFQRINKYYHFLGPFWDLPVGFIPLVPFVILYFSPYNRVYEYYREKSNKQQHPYLDFTSNIRQPYWIKAQVSNMYGLPPSY